MEPSSRLHGFHRVPLRDSHSIRFPSWFLYVGPLYFFGAIALVVVLGKKIQVSYTPATDSDGRNVKWLWLGVGLYSLIFLNGLRLGLVNADEIALVSIVVGEVVNGAILTILILTNTISSPGSRNCGRHKKCALSNIVSRLRRIGLSW